MSLPDYMKFKAVTNINRPLITNNLVNGVLDFCNFSMLNVGGYVNIVRNTSGVYGGDRCRLARVDDKRFTNGTVWEGFRGNWVWESGIDFSPKPFRPSGVWINNVFNPTSGTTHTHYFDYPRGRAVFDSPLPNNSVVQTEYSSRTIYFAEAENQYIQRLMYDSWDVARTDWMTSSGNWSDWSDVRLQLPVIGVEFVDNMTFEPYQLGGGQWCNVDVIFYIFAQDRYTKAQITDAIAAQNDKTFWIPNYALIKENANFPLSLDYLGRPVVSALQYNDMVSDPGYRWKKAQFTDTQVQNNESVHPNLHKSIVRTTLNFIMDNI